MRFKLWAISLLFACGLLAQEPVILCTNFATYDWTRVVVGQLPLQVRYLQDKGTDLHSYQPTSSDLRALGACDLFIYIGGESDGWVAPALKHQENPARMTLALMPTLGARLRLEEHPDGDVEEEPETDEHIWLSLTNAQTLVAAIAERVAALDPAHAAQIKANGQAYIAELAALDAKARVAIAAAPRKLIVIADRNPLAYLLADYGLRAEAAFPGCSAESEASFRTMARLASVVKRERPPALLTMEHTSPALAQTLLRTARTDVPILELDSLQAVLGTEARTRTYLATMRANLTTLCQALGGSAPCSR